MNGAQHKLAILLDEGTPIGVAQAFSAKNHTVIHHSDVLSPGCADEEVVAAAMLNHAALIAIDLDMKRFVRRFGSGNNNEKYKKLNLIHLCCAETLAPKRLVQVMSFIEHEWGWAKGKQARRLWVEVGAHRIVSYR